MRSRALLLMLCLAGSVLAGCADAPEAPEDDFDLGQDLQATADTGIIRGVVVDPAIVPVAGVTLTLKGDGTRTTTNEEGAFGFEGLAPGTYFLEATKLGWQTVQQSVDVVAGDPRPPVVKVQLVPDPSSLPFVTTLQFDGFITCSFSLVAVGFAACSTGGATDDSFLVDYGRGELGGGTPLFAQSELVWESTQPAGDRFDFVYSTPGEGVLLHDYAAAVGPSPLLINANQTTLTEAGVPDGYPLELRIFNAPVEGTDPGESVGDPVDGDDCIDRPALGGCTTGVGATVQQRFTAFTHAFYGFLPPEGWRFTVDGQPTPPA